MTEPEKSPTPPHPPGPVSGLAGSKGDIRNIFSGKTPRWLDDISAALGKDREFIGKIVDRALNIQRRNHKKSLNDVLKNVNVADQSRIYLGIAEKFKIPFARLSEFDFDEKALSLIPRDIAHKNNLIPLFIDDDHLIIAISDPTNLEAIELASFISRHHVEIVIASYADIEQAIERRYREQTVDRFTEELEYLAAQDVQSSEDIQEVERLSKEKPIVKLVDKFIADAIGRNASDIHIRPHDKNVQLIFRIDGTLTPIRSLPKSLLAPIVSRIKIIGGMDITERRIPQDGRFRIIDRMNVVDFRVSVIPTVYGESVVIRILNTQAGLKSIDQLGLSARDRDIFVDLIHKSNGILLVTGPTGSGKSTTLYAALLEVIKQNVNIITIEDPVEYRLDGVEQIQINSPIGLTFERALRNILRHDPDVIMVGEIRDRETGKIAIESALTGHLVLSTLHTNDSAGSVTRLMEMGIEPYLVSSALLGVIAQRLVKRNCQNCLVEEPASEAIRRALNVADDEVFYHGSGCDECHHTGFKGRLAVYELLRVTDSLRHHITAGVTADEIREVAVKEGMTPLTRQALSQARKRVISLAEAYRVRLE